MAAPVAFGELGLSILGLGAEYPPHNLKPTAIDTLAKRYYPDSPAMTKVLAINRYTGIDTRSSIGNPDHPAVNKPSAPSIADLHAIFMSDGVPLAVKACRKALSEARLAASDITHIVSTTCTDSANPGFDHHVAKTLALGPHVERVLLHGVGCSGGLAALRTAANLCLGHSQRRLPARILVVALEVSTTMVRSELDSIDALQETRIGIALFSDCASAVVLSNDIDLRQEPVYDLLGWQNCVIPETEADLGFDVDPSGWKVVLSPRVPALTQAVMAPSYAALMAALPDDVRARHASPKDFDWAMHPGGATILTGAEKALGITSEHMRASYDTYINHGNSSSATIFSVLNRLRQKEMDALAPPPGPGGGVKEYVVGCAFGPGITVEMCMLRRRGVEGEVVPTGIQTPPETESEGRDGGADVRGTREIEERGNGNGNQRLDAEGEQGKKGKKEEQEQAAFISEALENVELD
ncbi:thiolase-like protein [Bombardia bombarda]|uniref:Thiolase-like protein n=1 Tax=Bombardia bombarda TaxID=252184 RepID=A0AA40C8G6_9PEZI|nr:thiolase-like protein [Bombardia bombarda]